MKAFIKQLLPESLKELIRKMIRKKAFRKFQEATPVVSKAALKAALQQAGIRPGDTIMVHSSMKGLGFVEGGPATVVDALLEVLGPSGNLLMPAFTIRNSMHETLNDPSFVFDVRTSPSSVGAISEEFRKRPTAKRSIHPTHSVSAIGPDAEYFTREHISAGSNFGANTPFGKLLEKNGKIVGMGINFAPVTYYHVPEDLHPGEFPRVYMKTPFTAKVNDGHATRTVEVFCHDPDYHKTRIDKIAATEAFFSNEFHARGLITTGKTAHGTIWSMPAQAMVDTLLELNRKGVSIYNAGTP
jgi:aminoglycoside N3'-acetyltransferase